MKAFVTGATGFIGRHLVPALSRAGHSSVCLVRDPVRAGWIRALPGCSTVTGTLADSSLLEKEAGRAEMVFHLAACTSALASETYREVNVRGTENLARALRPSEARLIYLSSLAAAGPHTSPNSTSPVSVS